MKERIGAVVLAAGQGKRMGTETAKQFLELRGKPLIYYALKAFEDSDVDEVVLVTGKESIAYCREEVVRAFGFRKVRAVVEGGKERIDSVYEGLKAFADNSFIDCVLIHDGARPLVSGEVIARAIAGAVRFQSCVAAMPVKDTIKVCDAECFAKETLDRRLLWQMQTPQAFAFPLIYRAYQEVMGWKEGEGRETITDDAMVVESVFGPTGQKIKLIRMESVGDYAWDISESEINYGHGINEWSQADLKEYLNGEYYSGLSSESQKMIDEVTWNLGGTGSVSYENINVWQYYNLERSNQTGKICTSGLGCNDNISRTLSWKGKVGLMYPSDYGYASNGGDICRSTALFQWNANEYLQCKENDWLFKQATAWTIMPYSHALYAYHAVNIDRLGRVNNDFVGSQVAIFPSIYLKSDVKILNGSGTYDSPYVLVYTS